MRFNLTPIEIVIGMAYTSKTIAVEQEVTTNAINYQNGLDYEHYVSNSP